MDLPYTRIKGGICAARGFLGSAVSCGAIITNSGNANACTGPKGMKDARDMTKETAKLLGIKQRQVAVCSTGVIGLPLPMMRIEPHYPALVAGLNSKGGDDVAKAIITSDTHEKQFAIS